MTQTTVLDFPKRLESDRSLIALPVFDHPEIDAAPVRHLVTLIHPHTEDEQEIEVHTASDSFCEVYREICHQRVMRNLIGYQIYETLCLTSPF